MKRKILLSVIIFVLCGAFSLTYPSDTQAEEQLEIVVKNDVAVKLSDVKTVKVKVYYAGNDVTKDVTMSFKSSKSSVVEVENVENDDMDVVGFEAWPKKVGKSTVTVTVEYQPSHWEDDDMDEVFDGPTITKTAKCTIKSEYYNSIRADTGLIGYNTRTNVFTIKVHNISSKPITIMSSNAMAYDDDYTAYDRRLRLTNGKSSIKILPGQTQKVSFKVIGGLTWYDENDFQIGSYWKWGGKEYWVLVIPGDGTWRKSGKKWIQIGFVQCD